MGKHKIGYLFEFGEFTTIPTPDSGFVGLGAKGGQFYHKSPAGVESMLLHAGLVSENYIPVKTASGWGNSVIYQNGSGNIGIGTTTPQAKLHVVGSGYFYNVIENPPNSYYGYYFGNYYDGAGTYTSFTGGAQVDARTQATCSMNFTAGILFGMNLRFWHQGSGSIATVEGARFVVQNRSSTGHITRAVGGRFQISNIVANATITDAVTGSFQLTYSGLGSHVDNFYGLKIEDVNDGGTVDNLYGIHIGQLTGLGQTNTPYSLYVSDPSSLNYFAGNVGIGTDDPISVFHMRIVESMASITAEAIFDGIGAAGIDFRKAQGTTSVPTAAATNSQLGAFTWRAHDGTDYQLRGAYRIQMQSATAADFIWQTRIGTGALTERMRLTSDGNVGIGTTDPQAKLHVVGKILVGEFPYAGSTSEQIIISAEVGEKAGIRFHVNNDATPSYGHPFWTIGTNCLTTGNTSAFYIHTGGPSGGDKDYLFHTSGVFQTPLLIVSSLTEQTSYTRLAVMHTDGAFGWVAKSSFGSKWTSSGSNIFSGNSGYVGIGTTPSAKLHVKLDDSLDTNPVCLFRQDTVYGQSSVIDAVQMATNFPIARFYMDGTSKRVEINDSGIIISQNYGLHFGESGSAGTWKIMADTTNFKVGLRGVNAYDYSYLNLNSLGIKTVGSVQPFDFIEVIEEIIGETNSTLVIKYNGLTYQLPAFIEK